MSIKYQVTEGSTDGRIKDTHLFNTIDEAIQFSKRINLQDEWETEYKTSHYTSRVTIYWDIVAVEYDDEWDEVVEVVDETDYYEEYGYEQHVAAEEA